jgi:hypothetical protein
LILYFVMFLRLDMVLLLLVREVSDDLRLK